MVAPNLDAKVEDGTRVAVKFGRQVTFTIDGAKQTIWTTATTVDEALSALAVDLAGAQLSASRSSSIGRQGLAIIIATEKTVVIIDAGKKRTSQPPVKHWPMPLLRPRSLWTMTTS